MAEIEIGVLRSQCLDPRISDRETLASEIAAWQKARNEKGVRIDWLFSGDHAPRKLAKAYPELEIPIVNTA